MVATGSLGTVRLEIVPWLTQPFGQRGAAPLVLEAEVAGAVSLGALLTSLAGKYPAVRTALIDVDAGGLLDHVSVVLNDVILRSDRALQQRIESGDSLVFLPAFSGGG